MPIEKVRYRFGVFEVDAAAGELRRQGLRIRLHPQPFQVLCLLLQRPGDVLTREEICRELWPDGTFVDYEHGVNAAVNRLREALRDRASAPRYVETLPRRGYRFVGAVEVIADEAGAGSARPALASQDGVGIDAENLRGEDTAAAPWGRAGWLAAEQDLPKASPVVVQGLFVALQAMFLAFYVGALANLGEIRELLNWVSHADAMFWVVSLTAGVLIPVRVFLLCAVVFQPPKGRSRYLHIWPFLLAADVLWSLSPFLLLNHISYGLALACVAPLVYAPFAQRSLVLMGALRDEPGAASLVQG